MAEQLKLFDDRKLMKEEMDWDWCPLFARLLRVSEVHGAPLRPWLHTPGEWDKNAIDLEIKIENEADTLELECPHTVRALKLYARLCFGKFTKMSHPFNGMTKENFLNIAHDQFKSVGLTMCI